MILKLGTNKTNALAVWKLFYGHGHVMHTTHHLSSLRLLDVNIKQKYWIQPEIAVSDFYHNDLLAL